MILHKLCVRDIGFFFNVNDEVQKGIHIFQRVSDQRKHCRVVSKIVVVQFNSYKFHFFNFSNFFD
jgi:hypothetical protein